MVIDEVQKVPALLDEVHRIIEKSGAVFLLTGSSARKLKHGGAKKKLSQGLRLISLMLESQITLQEEKSLQSKVQTSVLPLTLCFRVYTDKTRPRIQQAQSSFLIITR